jgi:hypothetical protein
MTALRGVRRYIVYLFYIHFDVVNIDFDFLQIGLRQNNVCSTIMITDSRSFHVHFSNAFYFDHFPPFFFQTWFALILFPLFRFMSGLTFQSSKDQSWNCFSFMRPWARPHSRRQHLASEKNQTKNSRSTLSRFETKICPKLRWSIFLLWINFSLI